MCMLGIFGVIRQKFDRTAAHHLIIQLRASINRTIIIIKNSIKTNDYFSRFRNVYVNVSSQSVTFEIDIIIEIINGVDFQHTVILGIRSGYVIFRNFPPSTDVKVVSMIDSVIFKKLFSPLYGWI